MQDLPLVLDVLDYLLVAAGAIVLAATAYLHRLAGGGDPLYGSPIRANRLTPLTVWCCLIAYPLGLLLGGWLGEWWVPAVKGDEASEAFQSVAAFSVAQVVIVATCLAVAGGTFRTGLKGFGLSFLLPTCRSAWRWVVGGLLASFCCSGLAVLVVEWVVRLLRPDFQPPEHGVFTTLQSSQTTWAMRLLTLVSAAVLAPVGEECLFRGIVQTAIKKIMAPRKRSLYHRWVGIAAAATFFGMMHVNTPQFIPALIIFGLILGYLYERTGSLWVPISVHMLFNVKSLVWYHLQT